MIKVGLVDATGATFGLRVTSNGELIVRPNFSDSYKVALTSDGVAVNVVPPIEGKNFIITAISVTSDKNVGVNGATIELYEATAPTSTVQTKPVFEFNVLKSTTTATTPILLKVTAGVYLNAETDDNNASITVLGYYNDVET